MTGPNIVLMVADDMGYGDFGLYSEGRVHTPALDELASQGIRLTQHYAGSAVCSPSRAALLTGRYPIRTGAVTPQEVLGNDRIALGESSIADSFKAAGYATGMVGKWHNGALDPRFHPNARGFDEFAGFCGGWADYYRWNLDRNGILEKSDERYLTDVLADEAASFIDRHQSESFFLMVTWNAPHSPLQAPEEVTQRYVDAGFELATAIIYAMIEVMDRGIAKVREALRSAGIEDDTLLMFTSDNGPAFRHRNDQVPAGVPLDSVRFNNGFAGAKGSVYEGGIRVPMIARWANGLPQDIEISDQICFTDWLPTLLSLTGSSSVGEKSIDGHDVGDVLRGDSPQEQPRRFWQWNGDSPIGVTNAAMRHGDWKLVRPALDIAYASDRDQQLADDYIEKDIEYKYHPENITEKFNWPEPKKIVPEPPAPELYDISVDPGETNDVAVANPTIASGMLAELETWFEKVEAERQVIDE
ncbi:MAG: sulfatase-like hydrolase/transferase [Dehalococcoidia bacterium]|nr:sulfatase-like hydrolase/transferase [Dehalococcoidia bacterium]